MLPYTEKNGKQLITSLAQFSVNIRAIEKKSVAVQLKTVLNIKQLIETQTIEENGKSTSWKCERRVAVCRNTRAIKKFFFVNR